MSQGVRIVRELRFAGSELTWFIALNHARLSANGHPADAAVAFVTCGGRFDRSAGQSEDNVVVFASLAP